MSMISNVHQRVTMSMISNARRWVLVSMNSTAHHIYDLECMTTGQHLHDLERAPSASMISNAQQRVSYYSVASNAQCWNVDLRLKCLTVLLAHMRETSAGRTDVLRNAVTAGHMRGRESHCFPRNGPSQTPFGMF